MNSFFVDLNHQDLMSVAGPDSEKFLQGQLTCDVSTVSNTQSCLAAVCDNKGRVIASFHLYKLQDVFYLSMPPGVMSLLKPVLEKYSVFYQCNINDASSIFQRYGLMGATIEELLAPFFPAFPSQINQVVSHEGSEIIRLSVAPGHFELFLNSANHPEIPDFLAQNLTLSTRSNWEVLDIQAGLYYIEAANSGLYTPQVLNYDLAGLISFKKGCYTGQEIVARMHYRGKAKKRLYHLRLTSPQEISPGASVELTDKTPLGKILKVCKRENNTYEALAILKTEVETLKTEADIVISEQREARAQLVESVYSESSE